MSTSDDAHDDPKDAPATGAPAEGDGADSPAQSEIRPVIDADPAVAEAMSMREPVSSFRQAAEGPASARSSAAPSGQPSQGASWGEPFAKFERRWTVLESRLLTAVLLSELTALAAWVALKGLSEPVGKADGGLAGLVFRGVVGATALGLGGWLGTKKMSLGARRAITLGGVIAGIALAPVWRPVGVQYFDNVKGWLQEGSTLTLIGGLRGIATRLTLWLALLGGSLATAAGKHIHIDVVFRFLPKKLRMPTTIASYVGAAVVCLAAVWGFFDHIAIESYGAKGDDPPGQKIDHATHEIGRHLFLTRKQLGLDLKSMPHVLAGERYDVWMTGAAWNAWVDEAGFEDHYPKEQVAVVRVPDGTATHSPLVVSPDGTNTRGMLAHTLGLVIPFGLFAIAMRFLLRALLTLSGHYEIDPDAAHREDIGEKGAA